MSAPEEEEETILEYAEYHGLASNAFVGELTGGEICAGLRQLEPHSIDDSALYQIPRQAPKIPDIRLTSDKVSAQLLQSASQARADHDGWLVVANLCTSGRKAKKLDLPLLKTDPDADSAALRARVKEPHKPDDRFLPSEPIDDEKDEGLLWTSRSYSLSATRIEQMRQERVTSSKELLLFTFNMLKDDWGSNDDAELLHGLHTYKRGTALDPISPPLSPVFFPELEPFVPSSSDCILPVLSDPASLLATDQENVEHKIFDDDTLLETGTSGRTDHDALASNKAKEDCDPRNDFQELESLPSDEHFPSIERHKKDDLLVDSGLTPPMPTLTYPKSVTFSDHIETMLLDEVFSDEESSRTNSRNDGTMTWVASVDDLFAPAAERTNGRLQHEQLQEAATTKKVKVPAVHSPSVVLFWKEVAFMRSSKKIFDYQRNFVVNALETDALPSKVQGLHRLREKLRWVPIPTTLTHVALSEELEDDSRLETFFNFTDAVTTSGDIISHKSFLGCLEASEDDDDEDEELGGAEFSMGEIGNEDLDSLLRKRKRQLNDSGKLPYTETDEPKNVPQKRTADEMALNLMGDFDFYSATTGVDSFMEKRGKKKAKLIESTHFPTLNQAGPAFRDRSRVALPAQTVSPPSKGISLPLPTVNPPANPTPFIVSSTLMQIRPIVKTMVSLFPAAQLIERDFLKHNESSWMKGSVKRSPVISPLSAEADLILSPSVGVIMTTVAKIKQKPLPGQKSRIKILERIEGVSRRYASVIVFVSEGAADESTRSLDGQDAMAYAEFAGFCSSQHANIIPVYVPGGPQALGTWMASVMVQHGVHDGSQASLMEDETIWELFLRRCGMNAYAAQSVIAAMRAPEGVNSSSPNKAGMFGLPGFVQMDHGERVRQFEALLGGTSVLERVSATIDTPWRPVTPLMGPVARAPAQYANARRDQGFV